MGGLLSPLLGQSQYIKIFINRNKESFGMFILTGSVIHNTIFHLNKTTQNSVFDQQVNMSYKNLDGVGPVDNRPSTD